MIEDYRIRVGPAGYNVEGYFNVTFDLSWWDKLIGTEKGVYGWHCLDILGRRWQLYYGMRMITPPAVFSSIEKAQAFIDHQKQIGKVVTV